MTPIEIREYLTPDGTCPFGKWLTALRIETAYEYWQDYKVRRG